MNIQLSNLDKHYSQVIHTDSYSVHQSFIKELLSTNDEQILDFHYQLLSRSIGNPDLYKRLCRAFEQRGKVAQDYLSGRIQNETDSQIRGDVLHILGKTNTPSVIPLAISFLQSDDRIMRYKAIIVLGWTGQSEELKPLNERLRNEPDEELRGYAATAMRQIWFKHPDTQRQILTIYQQALSTEQSGSVCSFIITCVQELLHKKFGIKESQYGEIGGNVSKAKPKALLALNDYLNSPV